MSDCPDTRWVVAGYSQGAMVAARAVQSFRHDNVIYVALFADPKLSLPEGVGLFPDACSGKNLSEYRVYVPNCRTHEGRLKARSPYVYGELGGKYGLWCAKNDYICGSTQLPWGLDGHLHYDERIPQLVGILRGRLPYRVTEAARSMSASATEAGKVYAILSLDEYYVRPGADIIIDAAQSFSLDIDIADYSWSVDGGKFYSTGVEPRTNLNFDAMGEHTVRVRVTDLLDGQAEYESRIIVTDEAEPQGYAAPEIKAVRDGSNVMLEWSTPPYGAKWLWERLNGFDLGYVDAAQKMLAIQDVNLSEDNYVEVAWSDDGQMGEWAEISLANLSELDIKMTTDAIAPKTGVGTGGALLLFVAVLGYVWGVRRILRI